MKITKTLTFGLMIAAAVAVAQPPSGGDTGPGGGTPPGGEGGGTPPGGEGGGGTPPGGGMPGEASGSFSYDTFISVTTNADSTLSRNGLVYGYSSAPTAVKADSTIKCLADGVFAGCTSLTTVDLSASAIAEVPSDCFAGCTALKTVVLPATCKTVGANAFAGCSALVSATGAGVTVFGADSFRDCVELVTAPSTNSATIGVCAFANCPKLGTTDGSADSGTDDADAGGGTDTTGGGTDTTGGGTDTTGGGTETGADDDSAISGTLQYADFSKAQTINGALCDANGEVAGMMQVKIGKVNKKGYVRISCKALMLTGKTITSKSNKVLLDSDGSASLTLTCKSSLGEMAFNLMSDGTFILSNDSYAMKSAETGGTLNSTELKFNVELSAMPNFGDGWSLLESALPKDEPITVSSGTAWSFGKVPSVKFRKVDGNYVIAGLDDDTKPNVCALKLKYTSSTGRFKGRFKLYATNETGTTPKVKKFSVTVIGFMFDGSGTGIATLKKPSGGPWPVRVE